MWSNYGHNSRCRLFAKAHIFASCSVSAQYYLSFTSESAQFQPCFCLVHLSFSLAQLSFISFWARYRHYGSVSALGQLSFWSVLAKFHHSISLVLVQNQLNSISVSISSSQFWLNLSVSQLWLSFSLLPKVNFRWITPQYQPWISSVSSQFHQFSYLALPRGPLNIIEQSTKVSCYCVHVWSNYGHNSRWLIAKEPNYFCLGCQLEPPTIISQH